MIIDNYPDCTYTHLEDEVQYYTVEPLIRTLRIELKNFSVKDTV